MGNGGKGCGKRETSGGGGFRAERSLRTAPEAQLPMTPWLAGVWLVVAVLRWWVQTERVVTLVRVGMLPLRVTGVGHGRRRSCVAADCCAYHTHGVTLSTSSTNLAHFDVNAHGII